MPSNCDLIIVKSRDLVAVVLYKRRLWWNGVHSLIGELEPWSVHCNTLCIVVTHNYWLLILISNLSFFNISFKGLYISQIKFFYDFWINLNKEIIIKTHDINSIVKDYSISISGVCLKKKTFIPGLRTI